jgi:hypothetical protein
MESGPDRTLIGPGRTRLFRPVQTSGNRLKALYLLNAMMAESQSRSHHAANTRKTVKVCRRWRFSAVTNS